MRAALPRDLQELVDRRLKVDVAVSNVARVPAAVPPDDRVEPDQLGRRRLAPRTELETGREPERPRVHRLLDEALHRAQLLLRGGRAGDARRPAHGVVA